ncbi:hypothetical protein QJS04_geneDACA006712 [Acorus gramineus]|uniref:Uncharacterized protein n=1 Tax=Acorus gramineus TaxID=55184 RepID=A0AAV9AZC8_ACOGR|nr:hypothetical protein QJS04_geneDACA006712 [Acorus gramineus]
MTPRVQHNLDIQLCSKKSKTSDEAKPRQDEYSVPPDETKIDKPCEMFKSPYISNEVRVEKQCYRKYFRGETSNEDASLYSGNLLTENVVERKICKDSLPVKEVQSYITSEVASVTHIISRYFSEFDETDTCNSPAQGPTDVIDQPDQCKTANLRRLWGPHPNQNAMTTMGSAREEHVKQRIDGHCLSTSIDCMHLSVTKSKGEILTPKRKFRRTEVGRRLLPAANEMGISTVTIHRSLGRVHAQHNLDGEF